MIEHHQYDKNPLKFLGIKEEKQNKKQEKKKKSRRKEKNEASDLPFTLFSPKFL